MLKVLSASLSIASLSPLLLCSPSPFLFCPSLLLCLCISLSLSTLHHPPPCLTPSLPPSSSLAMSLSISALFFFYTLSPSPFSASGSCSHCIMSSSVPQSSLTFPFNLCILVSPLPCTIRRNIK